MQFHHAKTSSNPLVVSAFLLASIKRRFAGTPQAILTEKISGIKVSTNSITLTTGSPLINTELKLQKEIITEVFQEAEKFLRQPGL